MRILFHSGIVVSIAEHEEFMTLQEARAIIDEAQNRELPINGPTRHYLKEEGPDDGVMVLEVEGSFTAEEFEAMAVLLRAGER